MVLIGDEYVPADHSCDQKRRRRVLRVTRAARGAVPGELPLLRSQRKIGRRSIILLRQVNALDPSLEEVHLTKAHEKYSFEAFS